MVRSLQTISLPKQLTSHRHGGAPLHSGGKTTRLALFSIIFLFSFAYIIKTTASATSGYQMHELEKQTSALETEVQKLQVEIADNSSMNNIQSRLAKLNMIEASGIKYFTVKNTEVAKK